MFGIDSSEFLLIAVVALIVIGPKDLPRVMRLVGGWVGKGRAMTRHLRSGFDTMMREAELEEMQKQWAKQNAEIMAATDPAAVQPHAYDAAWAAPAHDAGASPLADPAVDTPVFAATPAAADALVGDAAVDHPGALPIGDMVAPRAAALKESDVAAMTGPRPAARALADAATLARTEPAIALEPAAAMPTAQP